MEIVICELSAQSGVLMLDREKFPRDTIVEQGTVLSTLSSKYTQYFFYKIICQLLLEGYKYVHWKAPLWASILELENSMCGTILDY